MSETVNEPKMYMAIEVPGGTIYMCATYVTYDEETKAMKSQSFSTPLFVPRDSEQGWARHKDAHKDLEQRIADLARLIREPMWTSGARPSTRTKLADLVARIAERLR